MTDYPWANLATMFFENAERLGDKPFLWSKHDGRYQPISGTDTANRVSAISASLKSQGIQPGDRVALVSENRPEWLISDIAIMAIGAIAVPAYVTNTEADHHHILSDSGAAAAIVSTSRLAKNLLAAAQRSDDIKFVIAMETPDQAEVGDLAILSWEQCLRADGAEDIPGHAAQWSDEDTACIIYTSGTGGQPKGVMLSHRTQFHNVLGAKDALADMGLGEEVFLSFLPLSHSYEHMAGQFFPISIGAQIYYAEGIEALGANMIEARPTIMTAVPRLYETMHQRITLGVRKAGGVKEKMFAGALELGTKKYHNNGRLGPIERVKDTVLDKLVRDKVRGRFGGRLKALVSGGAPLNPDIGIFFTALGLRLLQGYGQTETAPVISVNRPSGPKMHTVGPPLLNTDVRIAEDGEILTRGDLIMKGYWGNDDATREVIRDGWAHTGDIGHIDAHGHLIITDRKKDIIVNSGGDNVAPQRVEGLISLEPEIAQALVFGDKRPHLVAVLVPDDVWLREQDGDLLKALQSVIERVNQQLSTIEKVRRFVVADAPFTIENEQMTPTMKVRRHVVNEVYGDRLRALYR
jgi:long-chain acyl-CoA synthetase